MVVVHQLDRERVRSYSHVVPGVRSSRCRCICARGCHGWLALLGGSYHIHEVVDMPLTLKVGLTRLSAALVTKIQGVCAGFNSSVTSSDTSKVFLGHCKRKTLGLRCRVIECLAKADPINSERKAVVSITGRLSWLDATGVLKSPIRGRCVWEIE